MSRATSRRPEPLGVDDLAALAGPCRTCLTWELDPVRRARVASCDVTTEKQAWLSTVLREWGSCGQVLRAPTGDVVAHVVYAPPAFVPGSEGFPTAPVSPDAVLMTTLWVHPDHAGGGLGRILVQAMVRDLVRRGGVRAVEAYGDTRAPAARRRGAGEASGRCVVPADFLGRVGFGTQRRHPAYPRMRMELRSVLTWRDEVEAALEKLRGVVVGEKAPSPVPREAPGTRRAGSVGPLR